MRLDRGVRIFTATTTKVGDKVWLPGYTSWHPATVIELLADMANCECTCKALPAGVVVPYWQLREYREHLADKGKPDEPIPPTIGRPRGNPATKRVGILQNGGVRGRC